MTANTAFTGPITNHPRMAPAIAPGKKATVHTTAGSHLGNSAPAAESPKGKPKCWAKNGFRYATVIKPQSTKIHHGNASRWCSCEPSDLVSVLNTETARDGVSVIALIAEMSIAAEIVSANCRKNCPGMPGKKAPGKSTL